MKAKYTLKKEIKKTKFKRTLNLGNRLHSQTATNSKKNLTIAMNENVNNNIILKNSGNKNKNNYNTIVLPRSQTNKKLIVNNHIILKSKDKNITKPGIKRCTTDQNQSSNKNSKIHNKNNTKNNLQTKLPLINHQNNITLYKKKINSFSSKKNSKSNSTQSHIILKSKNKNQKENLNINQKTLFRTPLRIRKNGSNGGIFQKLISDKSIISITESNNNKLKIENLKKELDFLKKEKEYKNNIIEKMREEINETRNKQEIIKENKKLKKEIKVLKANLKNANDKIYNDIDLLDKFKNEYINKKNKVIQLKNENDALIKKLDYKRYNNLKIIKNTEINIISYIKKKKQIKNLNNSNNNLNKYIEKKYKADLESQGENINNYTKTINAEQIKEIRYLIKMIFYSNKITKDHILNLTIKNLTNFNEMIYSFIQLIKINSPTDIILLKNYFTFICFNSNNKKVPNNFNINNIFNEINFYFNNIEKIKTDFDSMNNSNEKINQIIKECKYKDKYNKGKGTIDLNQFNSIFNDIYGNFQKNSKLKEIYDTYIYIMKNNDNLIKLNLYELSYKNININLNESQSVQELKLNLNEIKSNEESKSKNESSNNISSSNVEVEEADSIICNNFINELFNDCLKEENLNEKNNININNNINLDNICKDFVENVFDTCQKKVQNNSLNKVCEDFVMNIFDECRDRNKKNNIKTCQDFVNDVFDFCLKKNKK